MGRDLSESERYATVLYTFGAGYSFLIACDVFDCWYQFARPHPLVLLYALIGIDTLPSRGLISRSTIVRSSLSDLDRARSNPYEIYSSRIYFPQPVCPTQDTLEDTISSRYVNVLLQHVCYVLLLNNPLESSISRVLVNLQIMSGESPMQVYLERIA